MLKGLKENVSLADYTTFKIGGPARYFLIAKNSQDLAEAIKWAKENKIKFFVLGGGSNLLVSDNGYDGLVIKIKNSDLVAKNNIIRAGAGMDLKNLVKLSVEKSLTGMEWAVGIPGTVGGAVYGNAGAFGSVMADSIKSVEAFDAENLKIKKLSVKQCQFGNKDSIFKNNKNLIIILIEFELKKGDSKEIKEEIKRFSGYRKDNHPLDLPSAGCAFKNYDKKITDSELLKKYPELIEFNKGSRIPTSYLIDKSGLKGQEIGRAKISEKHANFIVNLGGAKARDVLELIKIEKEKVKEKFGIELEEEVQYLM